MFNTLMTKVVWTIIRFLYGQRARDVESAGGRAALQGKADTVRMIYDLMGRPSLDR
jgi:hypothetical protein